MTTVNQSVDTLLEKLDSLNMTSASTSSASNVKSELETLFTDVGTYNEGEDGAAKIEAQIATLEEKIADLEDEAQEILAEVEDKNSDVKKNSNDLAETAADLTDAMGDFQDNVVYAARMATQDAIASYKSGKGDQDFQNCFNEAFQKRLGGLQANQAEIQRLYDLYASRQSAITSIADEIETALNEVDGLEAQLKNVQATISLLTRTKSIMEQSIVADAYQNCDTDTNVPIYSGAKAEVANSLLAQYTSRYTSEGDTTTATTTGSDATKAAAQESVLSSMKDYYEANGINYTETTDADGNVSYSAYSSGDKYNVATNPELACLRSLYDADPDIITTLQNSGMNTQEIMEFISSNFNVGISQQSNGTWKIPNGHSSDAWCKEPIYTALSDLIKSGTTTSTADSVNQTQMAELKTAVEEDGILTTMYEAGFTFKEAMYTLTQLFPDAGIEYDLEDQSGTRTYSIVADSDASGSLYSTISTQILNYWNVGGTAATEGDDSTNGQVTKYDPITFQNGSTTYTFITDRNGDGSFDYTNGSDNELLGSENGMEELLAYDYNGDGIIDDSDYTTDSDGKKVYALDQLTLLANNQVESVADSGDVDSYKNGASYTNSVDFKVSYSSARDAGITSIDLTGLSGSGSGDDISDTTKDYDNVTEGYDDINGSSVVNQFTINMSNGTTVTGNETLNTAENLETFYGQIADDANAGTMAIKATSEDFDEAYDNAEGSDVIDAVRDRLEEMQEENDPYVTSYGDIDITADDIHNITGLAYLTGVRDVAESAAEKKISNASAAKDAAEDAVNEYFDEKIYQKDDDEEDK